MSLTIAVFSDVVCPWCYVGKRRLERALDELGLRASTRIEWLPFELNPDMPEDGVERSAYRERKFGAARSAQLDRQMTELGLGEGLAFALDRIARTPNTRRAHMLIAEAARNNIADAVVEALFRAYFEDGRDIGDPATLIAIAAGAGLATEVAQGALASDALRQEVIAREASAGEMQIGGVPFFIIDRKWAVSGAQPTEAWVKALSETRDLAEA